MLCPFCKHESTRVIETRESLDSTRRRRQCENCDKRFTTYERIDNLAFSVLKKNGELQAFDKNKIFIGIQRACEKRVSDERITQITNEIEKELLAQDKNITTKLIGKLILKKLENLDNIAYLRFVSVCNNFKDASQFKKELEKLVKKVQQ